MMQQQLTHLREILIERFSDSDLRNLCFDLGIVYEDLPGEGRADKTRELITHLRYRDRIAELVDAGRKLRSDISWEVIPTSPKSPDLVQMRADYLASLRQRFEYLDLGGIAPRVQNRTVKLRMDDVYIPLQARPELEYRDDEWLDWQAGPVSEEVALRVLARRGWEGPGKSMEIPDLLSSPRVVILGDPGCGKSTLLRHVAYAVACAKTKSVGEAILERLPILVRIVQFSQVLAQDATLTLDTYIREVIEPKWSLLFQHALDNGEALVLLDGLDEVVDAHQRKGVAEAIQRLAADYSQNAFLITSRIVGYQAARLSGDFAHYAVQPLPLERIATFVEKWYAAIEREAGEAELSGEVRERAEELSRTIQERPGIRRLAENPLLLTIIALVNWRGRKLPNRRIELYAHAAETLIESWPYRRQGVELNTERVIRLLSPVAYRIFATRSSGDITEDDLLPILIDAICNVDGVDERLAETYACEFLAQISERSGIFCERGYDGHGRRVFGFLHLTFAEYFTARYLAGLWEGIEDPDARRAFLRKHAHVPRWHEVVLLMAGDIGLRDNDRAERATRLLSDILTMGSDYEGQIHRDLLLAGECLADGLDTQPQAEGHILKELSRLTLKPGMGTATRKIFEAMSGTASDEFVRKRLLEQLEDEDSLVRYRTARALGVLGDTRAMDVLLELLKDEDKWMRAHALWALGNLGDERAVKGLRTQLEDGDEVVRGNAITALGMLGDVHSEERLRRLLHDESEWIRLRAVRSLEMLGVLSNVQTEEPSAHSAVQASEPMLAPVNAFDAYENLIAQLENQRWETRWSAAQALGRLGDIRAEEPLLARLEDENTAVRDSATQALGRLGSARAVKPLLAQLEDEHWWLRQRAAEALGRIGDTQAVEHLLARLKDENDSVQQKAAEGLGYLGDMRAVEPLLERLDADTWWAVQSGLRRALVAILNRHAPEPMLEEESVYTSQAVPGPWDS